MPNVTQVIGPLIGGVSQAPAHMRESEFAAELLNALIMPTQGITGRPGTKHIAKLGNSSDSHYTTAAIFPFSASDKRRYFVSVNDGAIRVVEADTGIERTVDADSDALAYLTGLGSEDRPFDAVASGDHLYVLNRSRVVAKGTGTTAVRPAEALVTIKASDYATTYTLVLNGQMATYKTPDNNGVASVLNTETIASMLAQATRALPGHASYEIIQAGSTIHIHRIDGGQFTLTVADGLGGAGIALCYGTITLGMDVPDNGVVDGFTVRVQGDPRTPTDDFWLVWKDGVWQECARPGTLVQLDASTMPHALTLGGAIRDGLIVPAPPSPPAADATGAAPVPLTWTVGDVVAGRVQFQQDQSASFDVTPADGGSATVAIRFDLDASGMDSTHKALVSVELDIGGTITSLASKSFDSAIQYFSQEIKITRVWDVGDTVAVSLTITDGAGTYIPAFDRTDEVLFTGLPTGSAYGAQAGVCFTSNSSSRVTIPNVTYPATAVVTVTADGTTVTHTVPDAGETGAVIAAAIAAAWPAGVVVCLNDGGGQLRFKNTSTGTAPAVTASATMDTDHTLWVPGVPLTAGSLVGKRFMNLTSGAAGTVTANTAGTITTSSLTGGSRSTLLKGDFIRVASATDSFAFTPVAWEDRMAGDDDSNPFPSFVGRTISNIAVTQNRMLLTAGEYDVLSAAGKFSRFFRTSTQQVLDADPIDVRGTASQGLPYLHVVDWNGAPHLFNGRSIYKLVSPGDLPLTPRAVAIEHVYELTCSELCQPVVVGSTLYVPRQKNGYTQLLALEAMGDGVGVGSTDATASVPEYLVGEPLMLAADADAPLVVVSDDGTARRIYVAQPVPMGRGTLYAWAAWQLDPTATPLALSMEGGDLVLLLLRTDGVYLESIDTFAQLT